MEPNISEYALEVLRNLEDKIYSKPHRYYHGIAHIKELLYELSGVEGIVENATALIYAIWFHDAAYDTTKPDIDNVRESAEGAKEFAYLCAHGTAFAEVLENLVLVTSHSPLYPPKTNDEKLICDLDLTPLAAENFDERTEQIRKEYSHVPDEIFYPERKKVLKKFLDREHIYYTDHFRQKYEAKAKENLRKATA